MAEQIVAPRTHPFTSVTGQRLRVVEPGEDAYLETSDGLYVGPCRHTGPEILKLSSQGRELWRVCKKLLQVAYAAGLRDAQGQPDGPLEDALRVLDATAQTFDRDEPEAASHDPNRPIPLVGPEEVDRAEIKSAPKFGELLRGVHASEGNPRRDGLFVREIRRTGKLNAGVWYELTDGLGDFWEYPAQSVTRVTKGGA